MDIFKIRTDTIAWPQSFAWDHLCFGQQRLGIAKINDHIPTLHAFHNASNHLAFAFLILLHGLVALCFTHLLQNDLFGSLCRDTTKLHRFQRLFDESPDLDIGVALSRLAQRPLAIRKLDFLGIISKHFPPPECIVLSGVLVDGNAGVNIIFVTLARGGCQGRFDRQKDDLLIDAFIAG